MGGGRLCFVAVREAEGLSITCSTLPPMDPQQGGYTGTAHSSTSGGFPSIGGCSEENHVLVVERQ